MLWRFGASLEWLLERIRVGEEEIERIRRNVDLEEWAKNEVLRSARMKNICGVLEEVEKDPCLHTRDTTTRIDGSAAAETTSAGR